MRLFYALVANLLRLPFFPLWLVARLVGRPRAAWLELTLHERIAEVVPQRAFWMRFVPGLDRRVPTSLPKLRRLVEHVGADPRIAGVVITMPALALPWARAESLREVLTNLRGAGKRVVVHLPEGGGHVTLFVASAADRILLGPGATLSTLGLAAEVRHVREALEKLGLKVEPFTCGEYKTALERFTHERMSDAQREQLEVLLRTYERTFAEALAARGVDVDAMFAAGLHRGEAAVEAKLVDARAHADEVRSFLGIARSDGSVDAGNLAAPRPISAGRYLGYHEARFFRPLRARPHIALLALQGTIMPGPRAERWIAALRTARRDPNVRGVVLLVDSPGGSALTSEHLHREVFRLRETKPVVACFDSVAASGGYYLATHVDAIVARATTVTGSIGVVSARLLARDLLERLGVRTEVVRTRAHADMQSPARELDEAERAILRRELDGTYETFLGHVASGRQLPHDDVVALAGGRVWSGADAVERKLVDRLGGVEIARDEVLTRLRAKGERGPLKLELLRGVRGDVPPADPTSPAAFVLERLAPDLGPLTALLGTRERALVIALDLPEVV